MRTSTRFTIPALLLSVVAIPLVVACGSKSTSDPNSNGYPNNGQYPSNGYPPPGYATASAQPGYPTQPGYPPQPGQPQPGQPGQPTQPASPLSGATQTALDLVIQGVSKTDAPGMDAEQQPIAGTIAEGQHVDGLVTLSPGKCYTIIAAGAVNTLTRVDLNLYAPPLYNMSAGSDSSGINAPAVIGRGGKALCPQIPFALSYKVEITAKKGTGDVRAQLFSKAKK